MKILLTGAAGFIGSHLLHELIKNGHEVTILLRKSSDTWRITSVLKKTHRIEETELEHYFSSNKPDTVFHFATYYVKTHKPDDVSKMVDSNIRLPSIILELAHQFGTKNFINIGTCFEYSQSLKKISENTPTDPYNLYASTKVAFEKILEFYASQEKMRAITLRLFYPYGEKDNVKVIPLMVKSLLSNEKIVISKGEQNLDYLYVGDIVEACMKSLEFINSDKYKQYEIFNIGEGKAKQLKQIADILNKLHGKELIFCEREYPENDIMNMVADISKANKILNWQPNTSIETGLQNVLEYYKNYEK